MRSVDNVTTAIRDKNTEKSTTTLRVLSFSAAHFFERGTFTLFGRVGYSPIQVSAASLLQEKVIFIE